MLDRNAQFSPSQFSSLSSLGVLRIFSGGDPYRYLMLPFLSLTIISTQPDILPTSISRLADLVDIILFTCKDKLVLVFIIFLVWRSLLRFQQRRLIWVLLR